MHYLDTSVVISALSREDRSSGAVEWLVGNSQDSVISSWTLAELSNVFARRARSGELTDRQHALAMGAVARLSQSLVRVQLGDVDLLAAARMVDRWNLGLRIADALHLAACLRHGCHLVTFDHRMQEVARVMGVSVVDSATS